MPQPANNLLAPRCITTRRSTQCLAQRTGDDVDTAHYAAILVSAAAMLAQETRCVTVVDHRECVELAGKGNRMHFATLTTSDGSWEIGTGLDGAKAKWLAELIEERRQVALNNRQINNGYVLLCIARPLSDCTFEIGTESHDKLYRNPFLDPLEPHELKADIATPKET